MHTRLKRLFLRRLQTKGQKLGQKLEHRLSQQRDVEAKVKFERNGRATVHIDLFSRERVDRPLALRRAEITEDEGTIDDEAEGESISQTAW